MHGGDALCGKCKDALANARSKQQCTKRDVRMGISFQSQIVERSNCVACASASYLALVRINRKAESTYMN